MTSRRKGSLGARAWWLGDLIRLVVFCRLPPLYFLPAGTSPLCCALLLPLLQGDPSLFEVSPLLMARNCPNKHDNQIHSLCSLESHGTFQNKTTHFKLTVGIQSRLSPLDLLIFWISCPAFPPGPFPAIEEFSVNVHSRGTQRWGGLCRTQACCYCQKKSRLGTDHTTCPLSILPSHDP